MRNPDLIAGDFDGKTMRLVMVRRARVLVKRISPIGLQLYRRGDTLTMPR